jgi:hypothetical protein
MIITARAENRSFWLLSALRAHTRTHAKTPYKTDLHRKTLRALKRPGGPGQKNTMSDRVCTEIDDAGQSKHQTPEKQQLVSW